MATLGHIAAEQARHRTQEMFRATLAGWAHDVLRLRAAGLDRPSARDGRPVVTAPARRAA